jgi:hypothetical protein
VTGITGNRVLRLLLKKYREFVDAVHLPLYERKHFRQFPLQKAHGGKTL